MDQNERVPFTAGLSSLGFSPNFVNAIHPDGRDLFPDLNFDEVRDVGLSGGIAAAVEGALFDQRRALEAVRAATAQSRRRPAPARDRDHDLQRKRRRLHVQPRLHQPAGCREQRPRAGERSPGPAQARTGRLRSRRARVVRALLGRLRPGRLARRLELHAELRRALRARGRPPGDREPADGGVRPERGQPDRRPGQQDRDAAPGPDDHGRRDLRRRERRARRAGQPAARHGLAARRARLDARRQGPSSAPATACSPRRGSTRRPSTARSASRGRPT